MAPSTIMYNENPFAHRLMTAKQLVPETLSAMKNVYENRDKKAENGFIHSGMDDLYFRKGTLSFLCATDFKQDMAGSFFLDIGNRQNKSAGWITTEPDELTDFCEWLIDVEAGISYPFPWDCDENDLQKGTKIAEILSEKNLLFADVPNGSFEKIENAIYTMVTDHQAEVVFINSFDYLAEVVYPGNKETCVNDMEKLLSSFRNLAKKHNIAIVMLMDFPEWTWQDELPPKLSDFKSNVIIPKMADMVLLLYNAEYDAVNHYRAEKYRLDILKDVNGGCATYSFDYDFNYSKFVLTCSPHGRISHA